jgi:hypothetical protein
MKKALSLWLVFLFVVFITVLAFPRTAGKASTPSKYEVIETNYLTGLNSNNPGLQMSCAYFLGEMKSGKAVIPLMEKFNNEKNEGAKLVYAWALLKIGDARGVYLVKRECEIGNCENIRPMLAQFYNDYLLKTNGKISN